MDEIAEAVRTLTIVAMSDGSFASIVYDRHQDEPMEIKDPRTVEEVEHDIQEFLNGR